MRSRLNLALVVGAGLLALVLTVVRQSPEGVVSLELDTQEVRAAPGRPQVARHDLTALKIFNITLVRIKDRYVDPGRVDPKKMLYAALDGVQFNIPEVLVEPDLAHDKVKITVNDKPEVFETDDVDSPWRLAAKLKKIFRFIEANMNAGADLAKVEYAAVNGMLSTLDPHSILMDPEQARDMDVSTSGKFGGLGIVIRMVDSKLMVIRPMKNTPAWRKGIKAGDHIVRINHENTENLTSNEAVDRMRGDPKTAVTLWIARKGHEGLMRFDVTRDIIRVSQVEHKLLDARQSGKVGYIKVKQFSKGISTDVADALRQMSAQGATSWILDLRGNPGGLLEEAVQLSDLFVDSGTVVTTVSGRDREARRAEHGIGDTKSPLVVLVNGGSASASEIVAGALKNLDRAVIIGTRTFGKGTVQELYDNEDKSKLKLTIAQYLTPGDRSIQNLGIVPDIALQRMYVPDKNDAPEDFIRLLPPTRTYGEKDLDATLVSSYAKDTDKPAYEVPFIVERKQPAAGDEPAVRPADDDEEQDDADEIVEDFEMKLAKEVVTSTAASSRPRLIASARKAVERIRSDEEKKLIAALGKLGVDWSAPQVAEAAAPSLEVSLQAPANVKAGDVVTVTATVKNTGLGTAYRVLPRIHADNDSPFDDAELPVGKIGPGETKTFATKLRVPKDALDRKHRLGLEVREARNAHARITPGEVLVEAAPRPVFAYAYQLIDDGNGDGLVQRGEKYRLNVQLKNSGAGPTAKATVLLRNATGDGVVLERSRVELKDTPLQPGQVKELEFKLRSDATLKGDELIVELMAYDAELDVQSSEKLRFKVQPSVAVTRAPPQVTLKTPMVIRAGASEATSIVGSAPKGATYATLGVYGPFTKVRVGTRVGFLPTSALAQGGTGGNTFVPAWNSTPPVITVNHHKGLETTADTYKLDGKITDEQNVEDVYIFVSNATAKIESRKVFYRSNRGGKDKKAMSFMADLPLWPGTNTVTVVGRSNAQVRSIKTMFIYRDPPRTAQQTPAPAQPIATP